MKIFNNFVTINTEEDVRILGGCTMNKLALGLTTTALTAILALGAGQEVGAANTVSYDSTAVAGVSVSIDTLYSLAKRSCVFIAQSSYRASVFFGLPLTLLDARREATSCAPSILS